MAHSAITAIAVTVVLLVLLSGAAVTSLWCCCRRKRKQKPSKNNPENVTRVDSEEDPTRDISDVISLPTTANSGYLYIDSVPCSQYSEKWKDFPSEKMSASCEKRKVLVTQTTVTTKMHVVELPEGVSLQKGKFPVSNAQSGYLDLLPVEDGAKSYR